jgi:hypothetical protein
MAAFDRGIVQNEEQGGLASTLRKRIFPNQISGGGGIEYAPHWSLLPLLSFGPVVTAQSRIINLECMKLLFSKDNLRDHLKLQKDFQLLGNGLFCSRLSHALFDPELGSAEQDDGVRLGGGSMGLRLTGRHTWPPAGSELRLALAGVLSESYRPGNGSGPMAESGSWRIKSELPGDMSFAVRNLSAEAIERSMDPDSIEALDFLKLSYKPPPPLRPIMTPSIINKYDLIFKQLLRMLRMLYVVNQLFRDVLPRASLRNCPDNATFRFRVEAHHFVSQVTAYFTDNGIGIPWASFESWLDKVETGLGDYSGRPASRKTPSPDDVRDYQEQILGKIMLMLLLRKRQQPLLRLLEDIFTVILHFAKAMRARNSLAYGGEPVGMVTELYRSFRKKLEVFITVCKGLNEKSRYGGKSERIHDPMTDEKVRGRFGEEHALSRLLLMLDMSGYYGARLS